MRIKRDADAPATVQAKKQRPVRVAVQTQARAQAEACVDEYFDRFRNHNERNGTNARGGGTQTVTDATIMQSLRELCSLKGPAAGAVLHRFLVAYGVVRTFAGLGKLDEPDKYKRLAPLAARLIAIHKASRGIHPEDVAAVMAACVKERFGTNASFSSKFLNMLGRPVPIYSSECTAYLHHFGYLQTKSPEYPTFYAAWLKAFDESTTFSDVRADFTAAARCRLGQHAVTKALEEELGAEWFAMRGFDVLHMKVGGPLRK